MDTATRSVAPPFDRETIEDRDDLLAIHTHSIHLTQQHLPYQPVAGKRLPSEKHFAVYADTVVIEGSLHNPGKDILLYAREVVIAKPLMLDVSGAYADKDFAPGDLPAQENVMPGTEGTAGADGSAGRTGGNILICAQRITGHTAAGELSVTDIAAIGGQAFAEMSGVITNAMDVPRFEIGRMSFYGNQEIILYLEEGRIEGLAGVRLDSSGFDGSTGRMTLRLSIPELSISGVSQMTGSMRMASKAFGCQLDVSAVLSDGGKVDALEVAASLQLDGSIGLKLPFSNGAAVPAGVLDGIVKGFTEQLRRELFGPLMARCSTRLQNASLRLLASGGRGGRGQDGHPGMRGEPGEDGVTPRRPGICTGGGCGFPEEAKGKTGKQGGRAGAAGHSGDGGDGGTIRLDIVEPVSLAVFYSTAAGDGGAAASPGERGPGGPGGKGARTKMIDQKGKALEDMDATNGDEGPRGAEAKFNGASGGAGKPGNALQFNGKTFSGPPVPGYSLADLAQRLSLSQLLITQNVADLAFLNARTEEDLAAVADQYAWLIGIGRPFADQAGEIDADKVDPREQAVRASQYNSAVVALMRLQQGLNYFGHSYNWTPVLNLKSLIARTSEIISLGKVIEDQYNVYLHKATSDGQRLEAFRKAKQEIDRKLGDMLAEIKKLQPQIDSFQNEVEDYTQALRKQRTVLAEGEIEFKEQLIQYLKEEYQLDFELFLDMLATVIGAVGGIAGGVGGIKTAFDAVQKATEFSKKVDNVVKIFKQAKATVEGIKKAYGGIKDYIDEGNANAAKIVVDSDDFNKLLEEYLGKFPAADKLRTEMNYYLELSQARNMAAYNYSALVAQMLSLQMQHDQLYQGIQHINAEMAAHQDNLLPVYTAYLKDAYEDVQRNLLKNIYQETRAYEYWALEPRQLETSNLNIATQAATHQRLIADIDGFRENNESFSDFKQTLTLTPERFPSAFASLPDSRVLAFGLDIRADLGFLNMRYIIARKFQLEFPDIDGGDHVLYLNLIHSGRAVLNSDTHLDAPGAVHVFSHRPRVKMYKIDYGNRDNTAGGNFGEGGQGYIGLSPFTNWRIDFNLNGNEWLDVKQIKTVKLTFEGRFLGPGRRLN